jgi:hypothetical protein
LDGDPVRHGPDEESTEQQHVGQRAIAQQVRRCPERHGKQHGVLDRSLDAPGQVSREQQWKHRQHQQQRDVPQRRRRRVEHHRRLASDAIAIDEQQQAGERGQGIHAFPGPFAAPFDLRIAPGRSDDGHRMNSKKQDEADDKQRHGNYLQAALLAAVPWIDCQPVSGNRGSCCS